MTELMETPYVPTAPLLTGHFFETSGYRALRQNGVADWLLIYTEAGAGRFGHRDGEVRATAGDWILLRPGTPHDYGTAADAGHWELLWAHFQPRPYWLDWLAWPEPRRGLLHLHPEVSAGAALAEAFSQVHQTLGSDRPRRQDYAMNQLEQLLLDCAGHHPAPGTGGIDPRVQRAIAFFDQHFAQPVGIDDAATAVGLSPSRLAHLFRQRSGQTPQQFLETRRLQHAADLLRRTGISIKQIAGLVGFDNQFYFSARFKAWSGQSPTEYRRG